MKKIKKGIFFRIFSINLIIIMVSVVVLFLMQSILISQYIYKEKIADLKDNARRITGLIQSGAASDNLTDFLYGFSHSTKTNILIVSTNGDILLASANDSVFNRNSLRIDEKFCKDVMSNKETIIKGTLGNVYKSEMFTLQVPIADIRSRTILGAIFISAPIPEITRTQMQIYKIMGVSLLLVILISFALSFALSRRISTPIKNIGIAAKQFANGDFTSRVVNNKKAENITEISELTTTFNNMAYSLEKSDDIRNNFLSDVAHELRTPMTTIAGFVDGILDDTIPPDRHRDYLAIVHDEIARLSSLVNSFLSLTRLQAGNQALELSDFDINETVRRTLVGFEKNINEKEIDISVTFCEEPCMVHADMNLIRQVLGNLIENAIKFTNEKGLISISIINHRSDVEISVYNTGCGISEEDQKLIFERFYKADKSRSLNRHGTGIGLYIVKDILSRHNKSISVLSKEGEFAKFTFALDKAKF